MIILYSGNLIVVYRQEINCKYIKLYEWSTMYFKGRVTLFFANNYLPEHRITMEF